MPATAKKVHIIDILTTPSMVSASPISSQVIQAMDEQLPPNYRFTGDCDIEDRKPAPSSKAKPSILLAIEFSLFSWGKVLQAVHDGTYEHIIVYDYDCHDFDIPKMLNDIVVMANYRGPQRLGDTDPKVIIDKIRKVHVITLGSEITKSIVSITGDGKMTRKNTELFRKQLDALDGRTKAQPVNVPTELLVKSDLPQDATENETSGNRRISSSDSKGNTTNALQSAL